MKKKLILVIIFFMVGIYYWFSGIPFVNLWLHGNLTGTISVNVDGAKLKASNISVKAVEGREKVDSKYLRVKRKGLLNTCRYRVRITDDGYYTVIVQIPGECVDTQMEGQWIKYKLLVHAKLFKRSVTTVDINIKTEEGEYKAECKAKHKYFNGNVQEQVIEMDLKRQRSVEFDFAC